MSTGDQWVFAKQREVQPVISMTAPPENSVVLHCAGTEMLKIAQMKFISLVHYGLDHAGCTRGPKKLTMPLPRLVKLKSGAALITTRMQNNDNIYN